MQRRLLNTTDEFMYRSSIHGVPRQVKIVRLDARKEASFRQVAYVGVEIEYLDDSPYNGMRDAKGQRDVVHTRDIRSTWADHLAERTAKRVIAKKRREERLAAEAERLAMVSKAKGVFKAAGIEFPDHVEDGEGRLVFEAEALAVALGALDVAAFRAGQNSQ